MMWTSRLTSAKFSWSMSPSFWHLCRRYSWSHTSLTNPMVLNFINFLCSGLYSCTEAPKLPQITQVTQMSLKLEQWPPAHCQNCWFCDWDGLTLQVRTWWHGKIFDWPMALCQNFVSYYPSSLRCEICPSSQSQHDVSVLLLTLPLGFLQALNDVWEPTRSRYEVNGTQPEPKHRAKRRRTSAEVNQKLVILATHFSI